MADSKVRPVAALSVAHPSKEGQNSEELQAVQRVRAAAGGCGGACMHKTDGKLFCVAAPIPGAGAGEGERGGGGGEVHEMGGSTEQRKTSRMATVRRARRGKNEDKESDVESDNRGHVIKQQQNSGGVKVQNKMKRDVPPQPVH